MKITSIMAITMALSVFAPTVFAGVWSDGLGHDWTYEINGDSAVVTAVTITDSTTSVSGEIEIPGTLGGKTVTRFGSVFSGNTGIVKVHISDGVTEIGNSAFYGCSSLVKVDIPSSVKSISQYAFSSCPKLNDLTLPEGLEIIDQCAFLNCDGLVDLTIPKSVEYIGGWAFTVCRNLTNVNILAQISDLTNQVFENCPKLKKVTLPSSLRSIADSCFNECASLSSIVLPSNLKAVGASAFRGCLALQTVELPDSVVSIGDAAFSECEKLAFFQIGRSCTSIGERSFQDCPSLNGFAVDGDNLAWSVEDGVLYDKQKSKLVCCPGGKDGEFTVPNGVTRIGAYAFGACKKLASIVLPDTVSKIGENAFLNCECMSDIMLGGGIESLDGNVFAGCTNMQSIGVSSLNSVYCSHDGVVYDKDKTTVVMCPAGRSATVSIYNGTKVVGPGAFRGCARLSYVIIPNGVEDIGEYAFSESGIREISIPDGVTSVGKYLCANCNNLRTARIAGSVEHLKVAAFYTCPKLETVTLCEGLLRIGDSVFAKCSKLKNVAIPSTVTTMDLQAFMGCSALKGITLPDGLGKVPINCFLSCSSLGHVEIGGGTTNIDSSAFRSCSSLETVAFGNNIASIGDSAFSRCGSLKYMTLPDSLVEIRSSAFSYAGLRSIELPNRLATIGASAFSHCGDTERVIIPSSVSAIGSSAFRGCSKLREVIFAGNAPNMGDAVFVDTVPNCVGLVTRGSSGWGIDIPGAWNAINLDYVDNYSVVSFDANGGEALESVDATAYARHDSAVSEILPTPVRSGYKFVGWFTEAEGGVEVTADSTIAADATLYAHWNPIFVLSNTGTDCEVWNGTAVNESNLDFMIPATEELPKGTKVRILSVRLASLNSSFTAWDTETNKSDPYYVRINGVNSDKYVFGGTIESGAGVVDNAISYKFSKPCDVVVGRKYSAVSGNNIGGFGNGMAFLHSNNGGVLVYGSGADRASVRYVKTGDANSVMSTSVATTMTGASGYYPVYEIEFESLGFDPDPELEYTASLANHTITSIQGGWFGGDTSFSGETLQKSDLRIGPGGTFKYALRTTASACPYHDVAAKSEAFSFAIYADVSAMLSDAKSVMVDIGNSKANSVMLYRDGAAVRLAFVKSSGEILGEAASVAALPGYALYVAVCNPASGELALSVNGGAQSAGGAEGPVALGNGFQIGSVFYACSTGFTRGANMAISKLLGYDVWLTEDYIRGLAAEYPAVMGVSCDVDMEDLARRSLAVMSNQTARVIVSDVQEREGCAPDNIHVASGGSVVFMSQSGVELPRSRIAANGDTRALIGSDSLGVVSDGTVDVVDGGYLISAAEGNTLSVDDVSVKTALDGEIIDVDVEAGYVIELSADSKMATLRLRTPEIALIKEEDEDSPDSNDPSKVLVDVAESKLATKPVAKDGEVVGAMRVKAVRGLYYQASWGADLEALHWGEKVQAREGNLYLGVIKQLGDRGFYRLNVSEE